MNTVPRFTPIRTEYIRFDGGLDVMTPAIEIPPGYCRASQNFELGLNGGYTRITGYERYDGRTKPSAGNYYILDATITGAFAVGNTLTGATSGATGVIAVASTTTYFVLTKITGTFQDGETLNIGGSPVATSGGTQVIDGATTAKLHAQYKNAAADIYRADITTVPGSGSILGVVVLSDVVYAFRNNAGGTAADIYKSSSTGWQAVTLFYEVSFTAGSGSAPAEGATITQGANSATVKRVVLQSGSWGGGTAAGRFIVTNPAPGNFAAGAFTAGVTATCSGAATAITLQPSGRYEFEVANFGGATATKRIYGSDGANRGFEFDGTIYVPISTGMTDDRPLHLAVHKKHLFFSFGGSAQHSSIGFPYQWSPVTGASEISVGDTVTGFSPQSGSEAAGGALVILSRNAIHVLYGNSSADWNLTNYSDDQGAIAYSDQRMVGMTLMLDDNGMTSLAASANYGNFNSSSLSQKAKSWLNDRRNNLVASCVARNKDQYRLFFSDKSAMYFTFTGKKLRGAMPMQLAHDVTCIFSGEDSDGDEVIYFGSSDGYVYQMEAGTSFDGDNIEAYLWLVFNHSRSPRQRKRYKRASMEIAGSGYSEFSFRYELGYNSTEIFQPVDQNGSINFTPTFWDSGVWDSFIWDGDSLAPTEFSMEGSAENMSVVITMNGDYFEPITFSGVLFHYTERRLLR